jgi:uncharacterized protein (TIGR00369 family)
MLPSDPPPSPEIHNEAAGVADRIRASFARQGLMRLLGAEIVEVAPGRCVVGVVYRPELSQQQGLFHGAVVGAIADVAAGYAALTLAPPDSEVLTVEYKLSLYAPANGTRLRAEGQVLRAGRLSTCLTTVIDVDADGAERPCATALLTMTSVRSERGPSSG